MDRKYAALPYLSASTSGPRRVLMIESPSTPMHFLTAQQARAGIEILQYPEGTAALLGVSNEDPSAIVAPTDMVGVDLARFVQAVSMWSDVPVIVGLVGTSASFETASHALELGARAVVSLPCDLDHLAALVVDVGVPPPSRTAPLVIGPLVLDLDAYRVTIDGIPIHFTPREILCLEYFMLESPRVVTLGEVAQRFAEPDGPHTSAAYKVVANVRRKLNSAQPGLMETVHRVGYRISEQPPGA